MFDAFKVFVSFLTVSHRFMPRDPVHDALQSHIAEFESPTRRAGN